MEDIGDVWRIMGKLCTKAVQPFMAGLERGDSIYGFAMNYPEDGNVTIRSLAQCQNQDRIDFHVINRGIKILGFKEPLVWNQDREGLHVSVENVKSSLPVTIQIKIQKT